MLILLLTITVCHRRMRLLGEKNLILIRIEYFFIGAIINIAKNFFLKPYVDRIHWNCVSSLRVRLKFLSILLAEIFSCKRRNSRKTTIIVQEYSSARALDSISRKFFSLGKKGTILSMYCNAAEEWRRSERAWWRENLILYINNTHIFVLLKITIKLIVYFY